MRRVPRSEQKGISTSQVGKEMMCVVGDAGVREHQNKDAVLNSALSEREVGI